MTAEDIEVVREHHPNGALKSEEFYYEGLRHGTFRSWYSDGTLRDERVFNMGKMNGHHKEWRKDMTLHYHVVFENDRVVSKIITGSGLYM